MAKKEKLQIMVSPRGVAGFCHLYEPDTGFNKNQEPKYKAKMLLKKGGEGDAWVEALRDRHLKMDGSKKQFPVKDGDKEIRNKDGELVDKYAGYWVVQFSSKYKPAIRDAKKQELPDGLQVYSGDTIRVAYQQVESDNPVFTGVSLRLCAVQLLAKNTDGGGAAAAAVFDEEEDGFDSSAYGSANGGDGGEAF